MTIKTLKLTDAQASKVTVAAAAHNLNSVEFIAIAVDSLLDVCAEHDERLALMFAHIEQREK